MASQHGTLTAERWREFSFEQQVLMIGNEMNRASKPAAHAEAFACLLRFTHVSATQIPFVLSVR